MTASGLERTVREELTRRKRRGWGALIGGWLVFIILVPLTVAGGSDWTFGGAVGIGMVLVIASGLYLFFGIRCPRCANNLSHTLV